MKKLILIILVLTPFFVQGQTNPDKWIATDKALHVGASIALTNAFTEVGRDLNLRNPELFGIGVTFSAGLAKEYFYDAHPSPKDITANFVGCVAGVYVNRAINNRIKRWYAKRGYTIDPTIHPNRNLNPDIKAIGSPFYKKRK